MPAVAARADKRFRRAQVKPARKRSVSVRQAWLVLRLLTVLGVALYGGWRGTALVLGAPVLRVSHISMEGNERLSNGEVLALDLSKPDASIGQARSVLPLQGDDMVAGTSLYDTQQVAPARDALYVKVSRSGIDGIRRVDYRTGKVDAVPMPLPGVDGALLRHHNQQRRHPDAGATHVAGVVRRKSDSPRGQQLDRECNCEFHASGDEHDVPIGLSRHGQFGHLQQAGLHRRVLANAAAGQGDQEQRRRCGRLQY